MNAQASLLEVPPSFPPTAHPSGDTPSWFTPITEFLAWEEELLRNGLIPAPFDLDPCGHPEAPVSRAIAARDGGLALFGTADLASDDGLRFPWGQRVVFFNPPRYDVPSMRQWLTKCVSEPLAWRLGHFPSWTGRPWWHEFIEPQRRVGELDVRFLLGRLQYGWPGNPTGIGGESPQFESVNVLWRAR